LIEKPLKVANNINIKTILRERGRGRRRIKNITTEREREREREKKKANVLSLYASLFPQLKAY
jgi:hypothetical protein